MFANDATCQSLTNVLCQLAAVDFDHPLAGVVNILLFAVLVFDFFESGVSLVQAVGHEDATAADHHRTVAPLGRAPLCHSVNRHLPRLPQCRNPRVGFPVRINDSLCFVNRNFSTKIFKLVLKLLCAHAVACTQNRSFADESFTLRDLVRFLDVDGRCHDLVDIFAFAERLDQVLLPSKPRQHPRLNLGRVAVDDDVTFRGLNSRL